MQLERTIPRVCQQCRNNFLASPAHVKRSGANFCSKACSNRHRTGERVEQICGTCGKAFPALPSLVKSGKARYCSSSCAAISRAPSLDDAFYRWLPASDTDGCWEWMGHRGAKGYGVGSYKGQRFHAHRFTYELVYGSISDGMMVCHRCDNPPCCNPAHLFLGTAQDNVRDRHVKGRDARGESHARTTLTDDDILSIRAAYASGTATMSALARQYGVWKGTISNIIRRRTWSHVP